MRWMARALLFLVTAALPVFIAACYGGPQHYTRDGRASGPGPVRVIDEQTDPAPDRDQTRQQVEKAGDEEAEAEQD